MSHLASLSIRGFRSFRQLERFAPGSLSVLIGANGAGKSNFIEFFRLLRCMADGGLQRYALATGPESLFHLGPEHTPVISARLEFGESVYEFDLQAPAGGGLLVAEERAQHAGGRETATLRPLGPAAPESRIKRCSAQAATDGSGKAVEQCVYEALAACAVYHLHDTRPLARSGSTVSNDQRLQSDASNLAPLLLSVREHHPAHFERIRNTVRLAVPFFDDFLLRPTLQGTVERVRLEWLQRGSREPFQPSTLSDGTLRFIALITALTQPSPPATIVIDEPELGLHPSAITLLGEAIRAAATRGQVVVATQSPQLLDSVAPEQVVVVERRGPESILRRLDSAALSQWLAEYSLGELWQKNVLGGHPGDAT